MALTKPPVLPAWAETGDKVQPTNAEIQAGWPLSNVPPARQRWNWILNFVANGIRYLTRRGLPDWAADETYEIGDCSRGPDGLSYRSLTQNTNKTPAANPNDWERWGFSLSELFAKTDSRLSKSVAGNADVTLTAAEALNGIINFTGALTGNINVIVPTAARRWLFTNNTTGVFTLTVKTAAGTGYAIPQGVPATLFCDGTNVDLQNEMGVTQADADNSVRLATTAWVRNAMANIATAAGFAYLWSVNGYIQFPTWLGGWVVQWGAITQTVAGYQSFSFPITFPNAVFRCIAGNASAGNSNNFSTQVSGTTAAGSTVAITTAANAYTTGISSTYIAVGR